jgi:hypothetical protein
MGSCPHWYGLIRAAKYLGVAPWDLAAQPVTWMDWALAAEQAEIIAQQPQERITR